MRIVGGAWRGRGLAGLGKGDRAAHLRPTADRVRESIFNLLAHGGHGPSGDPVAGARVLDLFAGSGALGLEALSRGAAACVFVDSGRTALSLLHENLRRCGAGDAATVLKRDATRPGAWEGEPFDLVFLDPPYGKGLGERALAAAGQGGWLAPGALTVWEEGAPPGVPQGWTLLDQRRYGETWITVLRAP
ncbi:MAG: 16S rRNA (guanine(966)-N(2))-methyltransferase RsmD [Tranquillimonas sp.]